ncbi:MAG: Activator of Hsp90 ATPase 1 family protein [Nocardioidaceae bacterium]|nr:Activator of Hsp90 ATPase 1 family protein [Nocardioidaceae bacterium]
MAVDVETSIEIDADRHRVAAFASDPANAPRWYANISSVDWETPPPATVGSRITFVAHFLGRRIAYTYEVREMVDAERFVMSTAAGPFPMQTTYTWADTPAGRTRMTLRNQGEPSGFGQLAAPVMAEAMRRTNRKDLQALKSLLENTTT